MFVEISLILVTLCALWIRFWMNRGKMRPPLYPGYIPILGHAMLLFRSSSPTKMWKIFKSVMEQSLMNDGAVFVKICGHEIYVLSDPVDCLTVSNAFLDKDVLYDFAKDWIGNSLFTAPASVWKRNRKLLQRTFSQSVLDSYIDIFNSQARRLIKKLAIHQNKGTFDHFPYIKNNSLETICLTIFGASEGDEAFSRSYIDYMQGVNQMLNLYIKRFQKFWLHSNLIFSLSTLKKDHDKMLKDFKEVSNTIIQNRKEDLAKSHQGNTARKYKSFLDHLLDLETDGTFTYEEVQNEINAMFVAGFDTSAGVNMYTMMLLGTHMNVQEKVYNELQEVFGNSDRDVEKTDLSKLVYLEAVIKETLRLYPLVPIIARYLDKDVKLGKYTLSAGSTCALALYSLHRHPIWGPDVEVFRPERWLDPTTLPQHPAAFAGFSVGSRGCMGKVFAMMTMKITLAQVLRRYKLTGDCTKLELQIDIMLRPVNGHHIAIEPRPF